MLHLELLSALTEHHAMKAYWESGGIGPHILDIGIGWGERSVSRPGRFYH